MLRELLTPYWRTLRVNLQLMVDGDFSSRAVLRVQGVCMAFQNLAVGNDESASVFQSSLPLEAKLEKARTELLDLSARNRLLNMPRSGKSAKTLEIIDEQTAEIFRLLVKQQRAMSFLAGRRADAQGDGEAEEDGDEIVELAQPDDDGIDDRGIALRHADTRLQTRLTPAGLQKRLLDLYYDARTLEEEQGVNILFLALGSLKWIDPNNAANVRFAPLILVPVALERGNAAESSSYAGARRTPPPTSRLRPISTVSTD